MRAASSVQSCLELRLTSTLSGSSPRSSLRRLRDRPACRRLVSNEIGMAPIKDKWVCIVGASRGIGLEFARQFLEKGNNVLAGARDVRSPLLRDLEKKYPDRIFITEVDVESQNSIITWSRRLNERTDHIDYLINSAGIASWDGLQDVTEKEMLEVFRCNTVGPLLVTKYVLFTGNLLKKGSHICNITSKMGSISDNTSGGAYAYRASKCSLNIVTKSLSIDLADRGIVACLLHPGWVRTGMTHGTGNIDARTSVSGMMEVLERKSPEELNGRWYDYKGEEIPW